MSFEREEVDRKDCFLCHPAGKLLAHVGRNYFTMAGLGPFTDGYAVVATLSHGTIEQAVPPSLTQDLAEYAMAIQERLTTHYGSCILTEHGKMPICNASGSHCYHPHFLLFPGVSDPTKKVRDYFGCPGEQFQTLHQALSFASTIENYLLVSASTIEYLVFPVENGLPRQFARLIVAEDLALPDLASWQTYPDAAWAIKNAEYLRHLFGNTPLERRTP